jgi:peroxiredoxin
MVSQKAPTFNLPETYGGQVDFESYRGRPVLLVFWTLSSPECRRELSLVSQVAPEFRSKGIAVVAIHIGDAGGLKDYLRGNQIAMTNLIDGDESVEEYYRVNGTHKLVLVGSDGIIKEVSENFADTNLLHKWMDQVSGS